MGTKVEDIAALEGAANAFHAKVAALPGAAWEERWLGTWGLGELLAHMAGWAREMTGAIERVGRGERPTPEGVDYGDTEGWNAKFATTAQARDASLAAFAAAFQAYADAARGLDEGQFGNNDQGRLKIGSRLLDGAGIHHLAEHGAHLDEWIASRR